MRYVSSFDPNSMHNGTIDIGSADSGQKIVLTNMSNWSILLNFDNGLTDVLQAGQAQMWVLESITPVIEWSQKSLINVINNPVSICDVVIYDVNERVNGTYPFSLIYFTAIGNPTGVNTNVVATSNALVNDGSVTPTTFIESTPLGQSSSSLTVTNDGLVLLRTIKTGAYHTQFATSYTGNSPLIGATSDTTEIVGSLLVDQNLTVTGACVLGSVRSTSGNYYGPDASNTIISASGSSGSGNTRLQNTDTVTIQVPQGSTRATFTATGLTLTYSLDMNGNNILHSNSITDSGGTSWIAVTPGGATRVQGATSISLQVPGGSEQASVKSDGVHIGTGNSLWLDTGSISKQTHGSTTLNSSGVTIAHGLGVTPDEIILICTGGPSTSTYSVGSVGSVNFTGYSLSTLTYNWIAIKW